MTQSSVHLRELYICIYLPKIKAISGTILLSSVIIIISLYVCMFTRGCVQEEKRLHNVEEGKTMMCVFDVRCV